MMSLTPESRHPKSIRITSDYSRARRGVDEQQHSNDSTVKTWLQQIVDPSHLDFKIAKPCDVETEEPYSIWHPHGLTGVQVSKKEKSSTCKRHHVSSRSSSPIYQERYRNDDGRFHHNRDLHNDSLQQTGKVQKHQPDDGMSIQSESNASVFEKRPRWKTRQDRYESRKNIEEPNLMSQTKKRKARVNKHTSRPIRSRLDVMHNFASDAIPQTRLTVSVC